MTTAQDGGKVVSVTHRTLLPPGNTTGTHFCYRMSRPQGHSATGRIMSLKNSNDTINNRLETPNLLRTRTEPQIRNFYLRNITWLQYSLAK